MASVDNNLKTPTWTSDTIGKYDTKGCGRRISASSEGCRERAPGLHKEKSPVERNGYGNNPWPWRQKGTAVARERNRLRARQKEREREGVKSAKWITSG